MIRTGIREQVLKGLKFLRFMCLAGSSDKCELPLQTVFPGSYSPQDRRGLSRVRGVVQAKQGGIKRQRLGDCC